MRRQRSTDINGNNEIGCELKTNRTRELAAAQETADESVQQESAMQSMKPRLLTREHGPLYRQLGDLLRKPIRDGVLRPGSPLPHEAELAMRFGVSMITVRQALGVLAAEGLITKRAAKPAIVAMQQGYQKPREMRSLDAIAASTVDRRLMIKSYRKERCAYACEVFALEPATACYCLRAVQFVNDLPVSQITFYFPPEIGSRLKRADFDDVVIFRAVQRHLGIQLSRAQITVRAQAADETVASVLMCEPGAPVLATEMLYFTTAGDPIELTLSKHRADQYSFTFDAPNDLL